jgi:hypothetical protein
VALPDWSGRALRALFVALALVFAAFSAFAAVVVPYRLWDSLAFGAWSRQIASGGGLWFDTGALFRQRPLFYIAQGIVWHVADEEWLGRLLSLSFAALLGFAVWRLASRLTDAPEARAVLPPLALGVVLSSSVVATYVDAGMSDVPVASMVGLTAAAAWSAGPGRRRIVLVALLAAAAVLAKPTALLAFTGLLPALVLLRGRAALRMAAGVAAGVGLALAYDLWQARALGARLSDFLTAGNDQFWRDRGAAARWDALARAEWFGPGLRLLVLFGIAHGLARVLGARPRVALAAAGGTAIAWSVLGPLVADGGVGYPFTGSAIGIAAWLALAGAMAAAPFFATADPVARRTYGALLVWLAPTALAWAWQRADEVRHLAPDWAPLALLTATGLTALTLALARARPLVGLVPGVALSLVVVANLVSIDGLGRDGWTALRDLGPSKWGDRAEMENFAYGPFSYELNLARENVGASDRIVSGNGRLAFFFPGRVDVAYPTTCAQLAGSRFFSYLTSGESLEFAQRAGEPTDPLSWLQCPQPRLELVGEQAGIYEAFVVDHPPARASTLADCHLTSTAGGGFDAVFGAGLTYAKARSLDARALALGFTGTRIERTSCSRFRVVVTGLPKSRRVQDDFRHEVEGVGLSVELAPAVRYPEVPADVSAAS